jgi:hypothetical protein
VIPNATFKVTDNATGVEQNTDSSSDGGFLFPNLQFGSYKLTVAATGFQNSVIASVVVESGRTTNASVDMQLGAAMETVQVEVSAEQLNTTTAEVGGTINNKLVQNLPFAGRDGLNFAVLIADSSRINSDRNSTFNGLPNASLNITLDGMNNNSQRFKSGGTSFFAFAPARIDASSAPALSGKYLFGVREPGPALVVLHFTRYIRAYEQFRRSQSPRAVNGAGFLEKLRSSNGLPKRDQASALQRLGRSSACRRFSFSCR